MQTHLGMVEVQVAGATTGEGTINHFPMCMPKGMDWLYHTPYSLFFHPMQLPNKSS